MGEFCLDVVCLFGGNFDVGGEGVGGCGVW